MANEPSSRVDYEKEVSELSGHIQRLEKEVERLENTNATSRWPEFVKKNIFDYPFWIESNKEKLSSERGEIIALGHEILDQVIANQALPTNEGDKELFNEYLGDEKAYGDAKFLIRLDKLIAKCIDEGVDASVWNGAATATRIIGFGGSSMTGSAAIRSGSASRAFKKLKSFLEENEQRIEAGAVLDDAITQSASASSVAVFTMIGSLSAGGTFWKGANALVDFRGKITDEVERAKTQLPELEKKFIATTERVMIRLEEIFKEHHNTSLERLHGLSKLCLEHEGRSK